MAVVWRGKCPLQRKTGMNKTEAAYAERLEMLKRFNDELRIVDYRYEGIKLKLADRTYYTPDFLVICEGWFELHEVKGFMRDDANVKIKVAAEQFPWFRFILARYVKKQWEIEEV